MTRLPCPFCGAPAHAPIMSEAGDERNGYNFAVTVRCSECGAKMVEHSLEDDNGWCRETFDTASARALAAWNRRAASQATKG